MPWTDASSASSLQTGWPNSASPAACALLRTGISAASRRMRLSLSINAVRKQRILSVRTVYVLGSYEADVVKRTSASPPSAKVLMIRSRLGSLNIKSALARSSLP